jgi:hypothetical protein
VDEEELRLDIAEALGKATAAICLEAALTAVLVKKRLLTIPDAAELTGIANQTLKDMEGLSHEARELAESALRGFAGSYTKRITRN